MLCVRGWRGTRRGWGWGKMFKVQLLKQKQSHVSPALALPFRTSRRLDALLCRALISAMGREEGREGGREEGRVAGRGKGVEGVSVNR
ncbi:hypothetical protein E2C01_007663 [Portunus trituberculatus]|uniref:Uncharacterized protein n=1 Tax=Portunus trituberculatus TaxID=210409 RepID=A0A5B7D0Q4_PORTR|nr:hypothetical protein [Portunus trituberculatus]